MSYQYIIDKSHGSAADTLLAAGFARLLNELLMELERPDEADEIYLQDRGWAYVIELPQALQQSDLAPIERLPFLRHLHTDKLKGKLGDQEISGFDYERQRQIRDAYREKLKALPAGARSPDAAIKDPVLYELRQSIEAPDTLFPLYLAINQMKSGASFNEPVLRWNQLSGEVLRQHIWLLLQLFSTSPNPIDSTIEAWKELSKAHKLGDASMSMLQVINPTAGKGANRPKSNALTVGNLDSFWLLELLKFAGFFALAHPQVISGSKDRKTYILRPGRIKISLLHNLMPKFRDSLWSYSPARIDILAVLQLTRLLVKHERDALNQDAVAPWETLTPAERVHGLDVVFYKDMGSAFAVMNVASLNLPSWLPAIESSEQADRIANLLSEHSEVVRSIRGKKGEEHTEEYELLRRYRDFLSGHDLSSFLDFAALFGPYIGRKFEQNEYIRRFSVESLKELFAMAGKNFSAVINNPGFQNIASAIRSSTVTLQFRKGKGDRVPFDIRYGLMQDLVRSANDADGFISALSDFVMRYNAETAQTFETSKGTIFRKRIAEDDIAAIVQLLAEGYSPRTLARLLVAFASAKVSRDEDPANDSSSTEEESELENVGEE